MLNPVDLATAFNNKINAGSDPARFGHPMPEVYIWLPNKLENKNTLHI
jgi:hypothetical protein